MTAGRVVVTGADGFIGHALCAHWRARGRPFTGLVRAAAPGLALAPDLVAAGDLATVADGALDDVLRDAVAVVHLAARAHVMRDAAADPARAYRDANVVATGRLARAAVRAGVPRFLFASTVKVHGEASPPGRPLRADDPVTPQDDYARTKAEAERMLAATCERSATTVLTLRLPLTYGPGVKGNFLALLEAVAEGRALPLGAIASRRSLLYVGNLVSAIDAALAAAAPPSGAHLIADSKAVTPGELAQVIGAALGRPARVRRVPVALLRLAGAVTARGDVVRRLTAPLEVDAGALCALLAWEPPYTMAEGLAATTAWWRTRHLL